jgi:uncharacterized protein (TIGR00297 family)
LLHWKDKCQRETALARRPVLHDLPTVENPYFNVNSIDLKSFLNSGIFHKDEITMNFLTLDERGAIVGIALVVALFLLGLQFGVLFVSAMVVFLVMSAIATQAGKRRKQKLRLYEKSRGIRNVVANGLAPLIMATVFYVTAARGMGMLELLAVIGFMGSVAAITSDKFASEIGVLGPKPRMLVTMKKVDRGTSGGVSYVGIAASAAASIVISLMVLPYAGTLAQLAGSIEGFAAVASIALGGFLGNIIDSALGYYEEKGIGNKFSTNFICSISGAVLAMIIYLAL